MITVSAQPGKTRQIPCIMMVASTVLVYTAYIEYSDTAVPQNKAKSDAIDGITDDIMISSSNSQFLVCLIYCYSKEEQTQSCEISYRRENALLVLKHHCREFES